MSTHVPSSRSALPPPTDVDLTYLAQSALTWNLLLPVGSVKAKAEAGWVTLSGEVMWHHQRQDATECVRHLPGVVGIRNDITLRPPAAVHTRSTFTGAP